MRSAQASIVELEKGKKYRVFVELPRNPQTGKRQRVSKVIRGSRKDAENARIELLAKNGTPVKQELTLDAFFHGFYLPNARKRLRPSTVDGYEKHYRTHLEPLGSTPLNNLTPLKIETWLASIEGQARKFEAFKILRQILSRAVKWDLLASNPCQHVEAPKKETYKPEVLDAESVAIYLEHFRDTPAELIVLLALGGGFRRSELAALEWVDITVDGAVTISGGVTMVKGKPVKGETKTPFSNRVVYLPPSIARRVNTFRKDGPVFIDARGGRMSPDVMTRTYIKVRNTLPPDVPRVSLKNLRHTSLTLAVESGADILAVSRRAGHSNISITSAYYLRPHKEIDQATAKALDAVCQRVPSPGERD